MLLHTSIFIDDPITAMVRKVADQCKLSDVTVVQDVVNEMFEYGQAYDDYKEVMKAVEIKLQQQQQQQQQQQHVRSRIDEDYSDDDDDDDD
jgi:hypothetical protein